jgi:hypothetical protein
MSGRLFIFLLAPLLILADCGGSVASGPGSAAAKDSALFCHYVNSPHELNAGTLTIRWKPNNGLEQELDSAIKKSPVQKLHTELAAWESEQSRLETKMLSDQLTATQRFQDLLAATGSPPMTSTCLQIGDGPGTG